MSRPPRVNATFTLAALVLCAGLSTVTAGEFKLNGRTFTLADGFEMELIAGPPLVDRPITADFDEEGRLYVSDSSGSNDPVVKQVVDRTHRILRLEDTDGDGRYDKRTVFADRMMFPEGTLWHDGSLYVAAPPSLWKLTDTDGDGVADQRTEWFQGKTLTGCANDLHGPYLGLDGWIYWCKGAFAEQTYERPGRSPFVTKAAHIFRRRPEGSLIEPVMTGGMDNPVDVVFTPGGERIFTTTFLQNPEGGRRDGLIHAIYGGVYGKVHDAVLNAHPKTGPELMPPLTHLGAAAPSGLTRYDSDAFGPGYRDNLFAALFNMQKVTRHILEPNGATFTTRDEDFLVSPEADHDFHPTDVRDDADGSLVVLDTGGWYKLCCPTSQIGKPNVLGAIYRVRREGAPRIEDPRGLKLEWAQPSVGELVERLDDPRSAVRARAIHLLGKQGEPAVSALAEAIRAGRTVDSRRNAVWATTRIDRPEARAAVRSALADADATVRQAAIHSASVWRDHDAFAPLLVALKEKVAANRRAAAEALGRIGGKGVVSALLEAAGEPADRVLEHSLTYALIEIADPSGTAAGLQSQNVRTRRAALVALDQMEAGGLKAEDIAPGLASTDPLVRETASWIAGRHPEWAGTLVGSFRQRLYEKGKVPAEGDELSGQLARLAHSTPIQELLAEPLRDAAASPETKRIALRAMAESGLRDAFSAWESGLIEVLSGDDLALTRQAIATSRALQTPKTRSPSLALALLKVASRETTPADLRLEALAAVPGGLPEVDAALLTFLRGELAPDRSVAIRSAAADVLSKATLTTDQLAALTDTVKGAGPLEIDRLLSAFEQSQDEAVGLKLVKALEQSPARTTLRIEMIKPRLAKYGEKVQTEAEGLYAGLNADAASQKARLEGFLATLSGGDVRRGQAVFNSTRASCVSCHAIGYLGGKVGPDLTHIGKIRTERDLLEAILFPSASFVRSFEPLSIATKDGKVYNGLPRKDAPDEIVLATGPDQEARIARDEIEEIRPGSVSVMPAGLDQQLSAKELADLIAFLKACQ
ncbi:PVC-type heme-binding CxxCH protein [Singulisphaera acidiphila]|uniref:Putative membrane-bound dehydrogenase n=1 Tax=Singulisphaera acidiphila (strain ATCC BAA-1392 / DSM 18658 / VKM B-2454 / MOB10) TaxID=886293 RepID=L0DPB2_SINAD|nr:PVC-type heme-binding CxxCH protein [Singulisphaera acidiphila]AGA31097.1 putative membrane-bound dehydrogenase [Singulisphaera acidiphila DSM 18658]